MESEIAGRAGVQKDPGPHPGQPGNVLRRVQGGGRGGERVQIRSARGSIGSQAVGDAAHEERERGGRRQQSSSREKRDEEGRHPGEGEGSVDAEEVRLQGTVPLVGRKSAGGVARQIYGFGVGGSGWTSGTKNSPTLSKVPCRQCFRRPKREEGEEERIGWTTTMSRSRRCWRPRGKP